MVLQQMIDAWRLVFPFWQQAFLQMSIIVPNPIQVDINQLLSSNLERILNPFASFLCSFTCFEFGELGVRL